VSVLDVVPLHFAKGGLAESCEDLGDGNSGLGFNLMITVVKRESKLLSDSTPDGGLSDPHKSDQIKIRVS
jgi:hypothetical protein